MSSGDTRGCVDPAGAVVDNLAMILHPDESLRVPVGAEQRERLERIKAVLAATPYSICLERPTLLEAFARSPAGRAALREHPTILRARALGYLYRHRQPVIYDDELVIGNVTSKRIAANFYPEGGSLNIVEDLFRLEDRPIPLVLSLWEKVRLAGICARSVSRSIGGRALLRPGRLSHFLDFFDAKRYFVTEEAGVGHQVVDYDRVVRHGLVDADRRAARCLRTGRDEGGASLDADQRAFYESIRITVAGIRQMALNLAREAERVARLPSTSPTRREELSRCAAACRRVPHRPARTFHEGLQACWLVHVALLQEDFEQGMSFGRLDQILGTLYRQDLDEGRLTRAEAVELLASFGLKTCETIPLYSARIDRYFSGNGVAQGITVGGTDAEGRDATNELSGRILESYALIGTREPALHVRVHDATPRWFLERAAEVLQVGCGKPSFFGDRAVVEALQAAGMTAGHAREYAVIGCVEMGSQGRTYNSSDAALFNLPICLELALNEGHRFLGRRLPGTRFGARTPPPAALRTFDDVVAAYRRQVRHAVRDLVQVIGWLEETYRIWRTTPVNSMLTEGCLTRGRDVTWGGATYDFTSIQAAGLADVGDSLLALKRLVFEEHRFSLAAFVEILKRDFRGHERLRSELATKLPRFGNDDAEADAMTQLAADVFTEELTRHRNSRGGRYIAGIYSMTCHHGFGRVTGALPNGRRATERLSNGLSPADGVDRRGPTAVLNSAASLDTRHFANCCAVNLKFDQRTVSGAAGRQLLASLLQGYFAKGGMQVQINVLDAEMLRAARRDPSLHPGLVVRVAGYCAYFADLQPAVQDEIIERTAHGAKRNIVG